MASDLAVRWQQIQGSDNWDGLLAPLDDTLRAEIIRYGEFVQAMYDGINNVEELNLRYYSFYGKSKLFNSVGLQRSAGAAYTITRYLYCTENTDGIVEQLLDVGETKSLWMGFIAVSNDAETSRLGRRDIVVAFRGTLSTVEWIYNSKFDVVSFPDLNGSTTGAPLVHRGFLALYNTAPSASNGALQVIATKSLRVQVMDELRSLLAKYKGETLSVTVVGHSLGGALATLCAYDIANNGVNGSAQLAAFTYASPKVGSVEFRRQCDEVLGVRILRLVDRRDIVPIVPPPAEIYKHQGVELRVDGSQSPYIKFSNFWQLGNPHNLEGYLHTVAGFGTYVAPTSVLSGVISSTVSKSVLSVITTVAKTTTSTTVAVIDKLVAPLIGGDSEGQRVYNALKTLFSEDLDSLLEFVLNVVDITASSSGTTTDADFWLRIDRDTALVNKSADLLKDSYGIPPEWWVARNKGMVQNDSDGKWHPAYLDLLTNLAANSDFL